MKRPAGPYSVVDLDLDLDDLEQTLARTSLHEELWVVARRRGVPQAIVETTRDAAAGDLAALTDVGTSPLDEVADAELPRATVVVCSIVSRVDDLDRCLSQIDALDYPDPELLLVDNRPTLPDDDPLPALLARHPRVRAVRAATPGLSAARNVGIRAATGEVVAFTDDDVFVDPGWLKGLGRRFVAQPDLDAVTGLILPFELETPAQVYFERYYGGFAGVRSYRRLTARAGRRLPGRARITVRDDTGEQRRIAIYGAGALGAGANMAFRRSTLVRLRGFDESLGLGTPAKGGEDLAMLMRLLWSGGVVGYEPAAVIAHRHRVEYHELTSQMRFYGLGYAATLTALVCRDPRHLIGLALLLGPALRSFVVGSIQRARGVGGSGGEPSFPRELWLRELKGLPAGPWAFLRSRAGERARREAGRGAAREEAERAGAG
ncbi:glycosyltransferase [Isoptericola sp. b441]|uniref:Glycosyltransferase n=1 Tax=Actinotalea lenta TaxID=3064654 RepID=A0ABT9DAN4_9CELL|nr:glycosyltransferase [Isoptericola sp. b441]MDO8106002.1 glycosyltransferase [Isoptericola sp. b441]